VKGKDQRVGTCGHGFLSLEEVPEASKTLSNQRL